MIWQDVPSNCFVGTLLSYRNNFIYFSTRPSGCYKLPSAFYLSYYVDSHLLLDLMKHRILARFRLACNAWLSSLLRKLHEENRSLFPVSLIRSINTTRCVLCHTWNVRCRIYRALQTPLSGARLLTMKGRYPSRWKAGNGMRTVRH